MTAHLHRTTLWRSTPNTLFDGFGDLFLKPHKYENIDGAFFMQSTISRIEEQVKGLTLIQASNKMGIYIFRDYPGEEVETYIPHRLTVETVDDVITKVVEFG